MRHPQFTCVALFLSILAACPNPVPGCPACTTTAQLSLSEAIDQSDGTVFARSIVNASETNAKEKAETFQIVEVLKASEKPNCTLSVKDQITLGSSIEARPGQLFLISFRHEESLEWGEPIEVSQKAIDYITNMPPLSMPTAARLPYFLKHLEHPDELIAEDSYAEFAVAPYKDVAGLAKQLPRNDIRKWLTSPNTNPMHLGLYGLMLGLCGEKSDIKLMEKIILAKSEDFRIGIDGIMFGYLILAGEPGLALIEKSKLTDKATPLSEVNSAMQALRLLWQFHPDRIPKLRMRQAMRLVLKHPDYADLAIRDLGRWKDWEVQDQLTRLYDDKNYDSPEVRRAIIGYMIQSTKFTPSSTQPDAPPHVANGKLFLERIRARDPQIVETVEQSRF